MSAGGQRQEVRILAMAIGALVIAVALFVGVRSLSSKPAPAAEKGKTDKKTKEAKDKQPAKKAKPAPLPPSNRDPFVSVGAGEVSRAGRSGNGRASADPRRDPRGGRLDPRRGADQGNGVDAELELEMRLAGIMRGNSAMALIHVGNQRYYAQLGDVVAGFKLVKIGRNNVVLAKEGRLVTLSIQPEPSGGGRTRARPRTNRRR